MGIEDNREETFAFIQNWIEEIWELHRSWIADGGSKSMSTGGKLEFELGHVENCWEAVMEEIQMEEGSDWYEAEMSEITHLKSRIEVLSSEVEKSLKEFRGSSANAVAKFKGLEEDDIAVDEELQPYAAMEDSMEASAGDLEDEEEGDGSKGESPIDSYHTKGNDERDSSAAMGFLVTTSLGEAGTEVEEGINLAFESGEEKGVTTTQGERIKNDLGPPPWSSQSKEEIDRETVCQIDGSTSEEIAEKMNGTIMEEEKLKVISQESNAIRNWRLELEGNFEKMVTKAARERQSPEAVWVLGLVQQQEWEPVFLLVMGEGAFGYELEMDPKPLGPPPWSNLTSENQRSKIGPDLEVMVPPPWPVFKSDNSRSYKIENYQIRLIPLQKENGPGLLLIKHGPRNGNGGAAHWSKSLLQPPELPSSLYREHNYKQRCSWPPPPAKPPPHPPDFPPKLSRLESISTIFVFPPVCSSISRRINGKEDAAGHDPGDIQFHQFVSDFYYPHSLEGKACLKRAARVVGSQVEGESFVLPPPAEPPPIPPSERELIVKRHRQHRLGIIIWYGDSRTGDYTSVAETLEDLHEWKCALETALAHAPSASAASGHHCLLNGEQIEVDNSPSEQSTDAPTVKYVVIGRLVLLALEEADGSPSFLEKALVFIDDHEVKTMGNLRQAANAEDVERRVHEYEQGKTDFSPEEDAHIIGDCVKHVLRELPSSPVPASCCTALLEAFRTEHSKRANSMRIAILETFPEPNRKLLQRLLVMMQAVIAQKQVNRMSTSAVAACMAPLLLRPLLAGDCEVENQHFEMAGDSSLQLLQAAAAANHAQGIIIALLDEYEKIFGNVNQESSLSSELFSDEEGEDSGTEGETEYEEDEDEVEDEDEDEDNEYESDEEDVEDEEDDGSDEEEGETEDDEHSESEIYSDGQKAKVKKSHAMESINLSPEDEKELKRLEAEKEDLEMQIAEEVKGKESLHSILGRRKKALHEHRLALERDIVRMTEQLQNERDLKAALDAGLGISQAPTSANVDEKIKTEPKEMVAEEDGKHSQKQRVDDPGMHHNQQSEENHSTTSDRSIQPPDASNQETKLTNKPKVSEAGSSSHNVDKPAKSKNIKADGAYSVNDKRHDSFSLSMKIHTPHTESTRSVSMKVSSNTSADAGLPKPMTSSASKRFNSKNEGNSNSFTLSKLTTRLNFLKEKRNQIANELQNLDKGSTESTSGHSPKKAEKGKCPESGHTINKKQEGSSSTQKQEGNGSHAQQNSDKKLATEASSTSNHDASKKSHVTKSASVSHVESDRGKTLGHTSTTHHPEKAKPAESRSMRKRII